MIKGNFIDNLPKVYGIYTGGFIGFIILMAIGQRVSRWVCLQKQLVFAL